MPIKDQQQRKKYHSRYMRTIWYPKNKKKHLLIVRNRKKLLIRYLQDIKRKAICTDCGIQNSKHPEIFDFDHLANKKFLIGRVGSLGYSIKHLNKEILKCEIVCANCHRIRTKLRSKK